MNNKFAHSKRRYNRPEGRLRVETNGVETKQTIIEMHDLMEHLKQTASLAERFAFFSPNWAKTAGMLHDIGKVRQAFQDYLFDEEAKRGKTTHSNSGALYAIQQCHSYIGKILAMMVAGHHGGLVSGDSLEIRLKSERAIEEYREALRDGAAFFAQAKKVLDELLASREKIVGADSNNPLAFSLWMRMVFSALIDADYTDTANFMHGKRDDPTGIPDLQEISVRFFSALEKWQSKIDGKNKINQIRQSALKQCIERSVLPTNGAFYRLCLPTGGGKTLSSFAAALHHAKTFDKKRIIYVMPYMSIIDQTADVLRSFIGEESVLEHHSQVILDERKKLASERWDFPVILTTSVQFFESLFDCHPSSLRKIHRVAQSVIVIDEVQALPTEFIKPIFALLDLLSNYYGTTIILSTATHPAYSVINKESIRFIDLVPEPQRLFVLPELDRVKIHLMPTCSVDELAESLDAYHQVLCVTSTKKEAFAIAQKLSPDSRKFLTAAMCPVHRRKILSDIKTSLDEGRPCRVVSTSLIEAGVDLDFPVVYRAMTGMDSIMQSAGRCNRHGKREKGDVFLFSTPMTWRDEKKISATMEAMRTRETLFDIVERYFERYFHDVNLDKKNILELSKFSPVTCSVPFQKIAESFKIIDNHDKQILIPYDRRARAIIRLLKREQGISLAVLREASLYCVQVPQFIIKKYIDRFEPTAIQGFYILSDESLYSETFGLMVWQESDTPESVLLV